ncbi:MAG: hypothetical protein JNM71_10605 [Flavobacterium lindanitolerans]|uniref:DUF6766 family protein n=1 Tax=Flavobacterium lindanitolerans TaxID=428988 RepID=UPI001A3D5B98|nr:DUF6766 family protein [Flavobacterium lindanitolerans]MBL7868459.1 hypothetical protein [Flavobacterium lindanitolerans]
MKKFLRNNSLTLVFLLLFMGSLVGQVFCGYEEHNKELLQDGATPITLWTYLHSGHFIQSTFENWESEFLQMALFVVLTIFLQQKGSSESKDFDKAEAVDREPSKNRKDAPWPVKTGGWILELYKHSLTIVLFLLFLASFALHFYGSLKDENEQLLLKGLPLEKPLEYLSDTRFWFESFQNWQSEFLSVMAIIVLSIFLRQKGSPQSKPVDAPNQQTGEG